MTIPVLNSSSVVQVLEAPAPTNRYVIQALAMVAAPTDVIIIQGSATKTVRVKKVKVYGQATAQGSMPVLLVRRSTAGTLGSAVLTAVTANKHDTNDATATAVVSTVGTANITTPGTLVGVALEAGRLGMPALATGTAGDGQALLWDYATRSDKALVLRGTSDYLAINFAGAAIPAGGVVDFVIEAEEDNS
jgi:hypothetical protein